MISAIADAGRLAYAVGYDTLAVDVREPGVVDLPGDTDTVLNSVQDWAYTIAIGFIVIAFIGGLIVLGMAWTGRGGHNIGAIGWPALAAVGLGSVSAIIGALAA